MAQEQVNLVVQATDQATATLRKVSGEVENLGSGMTRFADKAKEVAKSLAVVGAAAAAFGIASVQKFSEVGDAIEKMSRRTGISTEAISVLRFAAEQTGTSIGSMEIGLKAMAKSMAQMGTDADASKTMLAGFNLTIEDLQAMTPEDRFMALGAAINSIQDPTERSARAMDIFGRTGDELIPFFEEAGAGMDDFKNKASQLGLVMDKETAAKAAKLNDTMGELKGQLAGVQLQIGEALMPVVIKMNEEWLPAAIVSWRNLGDNVRGIWQDMKDTATRIFDSIRDSVNGTLSSILQQIQNVIDAWNRMKSALSQTVSGVGSAFKNLIPNLTGKADGGPVMGGTPYIVGERGPEIFVPNMNGRIIPNGAAAGGAGNIAVYISGNTISSDMDLREISRRVGEEIVRTLKLNMRI